MDWMWLLFALVTTPAEAAYQVRSTAASHDALLSPDDSVWLPAERISWGPAEYRTSFAALWNEDGLYLRFDVSDPEPWHTMTKRDDPIWDEEVVEIFLDLNGWGTHYAEIELSPANVVCDVRMIRGSPDKQMDLAWNLEGIESRVVPIVLGSGRTLGWNGFLFLPWRGFRSLPSASEVALPPERGHRWRFNVFRIERPGGAENPSEATVFAAWSPTGSPSFHVPSAFRAFVFAKD